VPACKCYIRKLSSIAQFGLHWGSHNPTCPAYRPSLDPVDSAADDAFRTQYEGRPPAIVNAAIDKAAREGAA